jgi:hypothetical protein
MTDRYEQLLVDGGIYKVRGYRGQLRAQLITKQGVTVAWQLRHLTSPLRSLWVTACGALAYAPVSLPCLNTVAFLPELLFVPDSGWGPQVATVGDLELLFHGDYDPVLHGTLSPDDDNEFDYDLWQQAFQ